MVDKDLENICQLPDSLFASTKSNISKSSIFELRPPMKMKPNNYPGHFHRFIHSIRSPSITQWQTRKKQRLN